MKRTSSGRLVSFAIVCFCLSLGARVQYRQAFGMSFLFKFVVVKMVMGASCSTWRRRFDDNEKKEKRKEVEEGVCWKDLPAYVASLAPVPAGSSILGESMGLIEEMSLCELRSKTWCE